MRPMRSAILSRHSERLRGTQRAYHWVQWFALHARGSRQQAGRRGSAAQSPPRACVFAVRCRVSKDNATTIVIQCRSARVLASFIWPQIAVVTAPVSAAPSHLPPLELPSSDSLASCHVKQGWPPSELDAAWQRTSTLCIIAAAPCERALGKTDSRRRPGRGQA
jgi:hypothetical protein